MAGGPSTPQLAAAVSEAGGLGFLAAGYRSAEEMGKEIGVMRELTDAPFGINLFCGAERPVDEDALTAYADSLAADAERYGVSLGEPRFDDDFLEAKLDLLYELRPEVVSFTFGLPETRVIERLHEREVAVWVTVTEVAEAELAAAAGADALVVQGVEAGGHRGSFEDLEGSGEISLLALLRLIAATVELPLVGAGAVSDGAGVAAVLAAGGSAAQIGTALMLSPEAGTSEAQRRAFAGAAPTALTRAFTGRRARGIANEFMRRHEADAPLAYPHVHHLTAPLRAAARTAGDPEAINLWAGEGYRLARAEPAGELVQEWGTEAARLPAAQADTAPLTDWNAALDPCLRPDLSRSALLVIDMQRDFSDGGAMAVPGTAAVAPEIGRLLGAYRQARLPIVHLVRLYDGEDVDLVRRTAIAAGAEVVRPGSAGSQIIPSLLPPGSPPLDPQALLAGQAQVLGEGEVAIWKPRWSAFFRSALEAHLAARGVNTVVIVGCNFPNCPRATLADASARDLRTVLVPDAISGVDQRHLREAESIGALRTSCEELIERLGEIDAQA
jgi:nitronate monooxygenase